MKTNSLKQNRWEMLMTFLCERTDLIVYGGARFFSSTLVRAAKAVAENQSDCLKKLAKELTDPEGFDMPVAPLVVTTSNLNHLIAAILHFSATAPDLAAWCAIGIDLFFEVSTLRPVVPLSTALLGPGEDEPEDPITKKKIKECQEEMETERRDKKKEKRKKSSKGNNA